MGPKFAVEAEQVRRFESERKRDSDTRKGRKPEDEKNLLIFDWMRKRAFGTRMFKSNTVQLPCPSLPFHSLSLPTAWLGPSGKREGKRASEGVVLLCFCSSCCNVYGCDSSEGRSSSGLALARHPRSLILAKPISSRLVRPRLFPSHHILHPPTPSSQSLSSVPEPQAQLLLTRTRIQEASLSSSQSSDLDVPVSPR